MEVIVLFRRKALYQRHEARLLIEGKSTMLFTGATLAPAATRSRFRGSAGQELGANGDHSLAEIGKEMRFCRRIFGCHDICFTQG